MFENETEDVIRKRMLDRVQNSLDKGQTSVIYNSLASVAIEFAQLKIDNDTVLRETFAHTADRDYLIERGKESGLTPEDATYAIMKGMFYNSEGLMDIPINSRFTCGTLIYKATEKIGVGIYKMTCETKGAIGNEKVGTAIPVNYIENLTRAEITEILIPAQDEEDTEDFRERYFEQFNSKAYGGNRTDYMLKVNSINGVGACKPERITEENNPIVITIISSTFSKASDALVENVQNIIDPMGDEEGSGIAPYNHIVRIQSVVEKNVSIYLDAEYDTGYTFDNLKSQIIQKVSDYLLSLCRVWADNNYLIVRLAILQSEILSIDGILDINNIKINNVEANLILTPYEIPIFEEVVDE